MFSATCERGCVQIVHTWRCAVEKYVDELFVRKCQPARDVHGRREDSQETSHFGRMYKVRSILFRRNFTWSVLIQKIRKQILSVPDSKFLVEI